MREKSSHEKKNRGRKSRVRGDTSKANADRRSFHTGPDPDSTFHFVAHPNPI